MDISLIVALTDRGVMGKNNQLPWSLPNDLKRFKRLTLGSPMVMGRKTFDSIGRPLPGRRNLVITRDAGRQFPEGVEAFLSLTAALESCASSPEVFVIGGAQIFAEALPLAHKLFLTWIHHDFEGDVIFPRFESFLKDFSETFVQKEVEPFPYSFKDYRRI